MTGFSPRSSSILSRLGITVSTLSVLRETRATHQRQRVPVAGGRIGRGLELEGIELSHRLRIRQRLHQLTARIAQFDRDRVVRRQGMCPVLQREREIDRVARTPDAAVAVEISLETRDHGFAAHVEVAHGQRHAVRHAQVALAPAIVGDERERRAARIELHHAIGVGAAAGQHLVLVAHGVDLHARQRLRAVERRGDREQLAALRALGDQADVGSEQVARVADVASVAVVRRLAGIVALVPADVAVVILLVVDPSWTRRSCRRLPGWQVRDLQAAVVSDSFGQS